MSDLKPAKDLLSDAEENIGRGMWDVSSTYMKLSQCHALIAIAETLEDIREILREES